MLKKCSFIVLLIALSLALLGIPQRGRAQDAEIIDPSAFTTGIIAPDGLVNYSVIVMTGSEALRDVAIHMTLPEGATFVDVFKTPQNAVWVGQQEDGSIAWTVAEIPADTTIGPFTVIAEFADQAEEDFAPPAGASATVVAGDTRLDAIVPEGTLTHLAESGSITLDQQGTEGQFVQVGETGVWIFMEPATVTGPVTFTFTRLPITDDTAMPEIAEDTWWCTYFQIGIERTDPDAELTNIPMIILYPTRRTITPGLPAIEFKKAGEAGEWRLFPDFTSYRPTSDLARPDFQSPLPSAVGFGSGNYLASFQSPNGLLNFGVKIEPTEIRFAGGYVEQDNILAQVTNGYINAYNFGISTDNLPSLVGGPPARR